MIVIMRDAVMPDCCNTCVCSEGYGCGITGTVITTKEMEERPDWCPLEEQEPCENCISRQAAIDCVTYDVEHTIECLKALPSAQPEQRWIPCSERLPEAGVRYQVTFESGEVGYADFRNKIFLSDGSAKENVWETERYYEDDGEVIAWMPLPEPYKEGDE